MDTKKIFLASSSELSEDRQQFEILINRKNKEWVSKGVFLELVIWEDFLDALSQTRKQDEYNQAIQSCDIFVMLFYTKVGKYTTEEFDTAFKCFKATGRPLIFTYFKNVDIRAAGSKKQELKSLSAFQKKLANLGHFYTRYKNSEGLNEHFSSQLNKLAEKGFIAIGAPAKPGAGKDQAVIRQEAEKIYNIGHIDKADFQ